MAVSTGRGGAGNIGSRPPTSADATHLETPTIRGKNYTTGRGGSGNMAKNDPARPEVARAAQDVIGASERPNKIEEGMHHGRGGGGNVIKKPAKEQAIGGAGDKGSEIKRVDKKERSGSMMDAAKEGLSKLRRGSNYEKQGEGKQGEGKQGEGKQGEGKQGEGK